MATCAISGTFLDPSGTAIQSVTVYARVDQPVTNGTSTILPFEISTTSNASGNFTLTLQQSISVILRVEYPVVGTDPLRIFNYTGNVPATTTANFVSVVVQEV